MPTRIRLAIIEDAPTMAQVMVDTWLSAHRSHIPQGQWQKRRDEWTYAISERGWREFLEEIDAETLGELNKRQFLLPIYMILASYSSFRKLIDKRNERLVEK